MSIGARGFDSETLLGPAAADPEPPDPDEFGVRVEEQILAACPDVSDCTVVSLRKDGHLRADVLLTLRPGADPDADREAAVRGALSGAAAAALRSVLVIGDDRLIVGPTGAVHKSLMRERHLAHLVGAWLPGVGPAPEYVPVPSERVRIVFEGEGAGVEELTWGQREIWHSMVLQNNPLSMGGRKALDAGTTVEDVADELTYLLTRFPSMRTRLRFDDGDDRPRQELFASGETVLEVYDAEGDAQGDEAGNARGDLEGDLDEAEALAAAVDADYRHRPVDLRTDWPVRMAVVRRHGVPVYMVVHMPHLVTDGSGAEVMFRDVVTRETAPPAGQQMLEQARWQGSPEGRRQSDKVLRYFERVLREIPPRRYPAGLGDPQRPPHWEAEFDSPVLRTALQALSVSTAVDGSPLMLALYAVALARITGVSPVVTRPVVGNRFRHTLADIVCHTAQSSIVTVDVADCTIGEVIERARKVAMPALKYGYFDPEALKELIARVSEERGEDLDISTFFNDRRGSRPASGPVPIPTRDELEAARAASVFRWAVKRADPFERMFLHIDETAEFVKLTIDIDTAHLAPGIVEELARGIETAAIEAALDLATPTRVGTGA